ncbi:MAG: Asp-tRNA(Asn)/Glu-tRNA(Gln) amidotransferase subunit GatC [Dehalococcoidia bacterium]
MAVTRDDVLHLALLARLSLTEEEVSRLSTELSAILDHFTTLSEVDTDSVPPTAHALPLANVMRDDEVEPSLPRSETLANAPAEEDGMFRVRAVLE